MYKIKGKLTRAISGAFILNLLEAGIGFLTAVVLGRIMGASGYGVYSYAMALAGLGTLVGLMGQDRYAVREIAKFAADGDTGQIQHFIRQTFVKVSVLTILCSSVALGLLLANQDRLSDLKLNTFSLAIVVFVLTVYMRVYISVFQGFQKIVLSLYPDKLVRPLSFLFFVVALRLLFRGEIEADLVIAANALAATAALGVITIQLRTKKPYKSSPKPRGAMNLFAGWKPALPFALIAGVSIINQNVDVLMLGIYVSDADIGVYRISARIATLISFALIAVNSAFGPNISSLFARGNFTELQRNASKAALASSAVALPVFVVFALAGYSVLQLFGQDFASGSDLLSVLSLGQFVNASCGAVGLLLLMTKHAKHAANTLLASVILNVILNSLLIPRFGAIGAAYATSSSVIVLNLLNTYWVWRYLQINPTVLGFFIKKY